MIKDDLAYIDHILIESLEDMSMSKESQHSRNS
jgi:hypothetical protein